MSLDLVIEILSEAFFAVLIILLPILGSGLIVGVIISIFQAATSIQESTLTFVPKLIITAVTIIIALPFITDKMISFTHKIFNLIETVVK
ncbi:MAG: flagellar biosynthesis protein FliQ [Ignavibacteriales bacterium]|nr:flagellar biosynthesis protein FliQ [Ignavibacteriales bacterium]MBK7980577.1 flagellar biosynthesis protein FliQ [Ignavibacteriota bacterium]